MYYESISHSKSMNINLQMLNYISLTHAILGGTWPQAPTYERLCSQSTLSIMYFISAHMSNSSIHIIKKVLILRSFHTFQIKSIHEQAVQEIIFFPLPWKFVASVGSPFHRLLGSMGRLIPMELFVYVLLLVCTGLALCCLCTPELHDGACVPNYQ